MIDLDKFGDFLKNRREGVKLTQIEASDLMDINKSTLWRLENGYISPSFETILKISKVYKIDINDIIESLSNDPLYSFFSYEKFLDEKIALNVNESTREYANDFKEIRCSSSNEFIINISTQYYYFLIGVDYFRKKEYESSIEYYFKALKINLKDFDVNNIESFSYTNTELRILMNLSTAYYHIGEFKLYEHILGFCNEAVDLFSFLYIQIKYSYSILFARKKDFLNALKTIDSLILHCQKNKSFSFFPMIYYQKSMYHKNLLEKEKEIENLEFSKFLCMAYGYDSLLDTINKKIEKFGIQ